MIAKRSNGQDQDDPRQPEKPADGEPASAEGGQQRTEHCPLCGAVLDCVHCELICPNCGYREDCSDIFPAS
ncbi:MAG: hypothetical protein ABIG44_17505 [Planctomycetota bacterium]